MRAHPVYPHRPADRRLTNSHPVAEALVRVRTVLETKALVIQAQCLRLRPHRD
jgi:hypothetical protein